MERSDLLDQYRKLSAECEQYQTTSHQLESEGSNLRLEIMTKESEMRRLKDKVDTLEREIQEVRMIVRYVKYGRYSITRLNRISRGRPFYFGSEIVSV